MGYNQLICYNKITTSLYRVVAMATLFFMQNFIESTCIINICVV
ncbi:hypothetical protein CoNPh25_CDS0044 [Staphylococcus phage S-CoN_Ph25]|nr:hypothetical protein CoNPh25_CDS0044 [Staphylococcus phage S-CoN_Ph25]